MDENKKALLIGLDTGEYDTELSMKELWALCEGAGCTPVAELTQKRDKPDTSTYLGKGKLQEALSILDSMDIEMAIVDGEITAAQQKGMEDLLDVPVVDRTTVILDIFARNAVTKEGAIQVELAQLRYRLPRLMGQGKSLSRLGAGIGTRGPGETQLETDRRHILRRIGSLKAQLRVIEEHRARTALRRAKNGVPVIALAGYTNAGKSTLLNRLTGAGVLAEDRLFATLDPTARALTLPDGTRAVLIDTVGFIQRIPHHLIQAFQSTLRNVTDADVILNVCDATSPYTDVQNRVTLDMLKSLGCENTPVITVLNKWDLTGEPVPALYRGTVAVSSVTGEGIDALGKAILESLATTTVKAVLLFPYERGDVLASLRKRAAVEAESYEPLGIRVQVTANARVLDDYKEYLAVK